MKLSELALQHNACVEQSNARRQIDLTSVTLDAELITGGCFEGAIFNKVILEKMEFVRCDFTAASFFDCTFTDCTFTQCKFHKAEFHNCTGVQLKCAQCGFTRTEWYCGDFKGAVFAECDFGWSYLQSIDLRYAHLMNVKLEGGLWDKIKVYNARFESVDFGSVHPARILETDVSEAGDGTAEVTVAQFRGLFGI
jgi:uncharacterized protein YjbI with pentapeptide repeats